MSGLPKTFSENYYFALVMSCLPNPNPELVPPVEEKRLEALRPYRVLGTPGLEVFNEFVSVVAKLFDVPIALVSMVREADVVFVGNVGLSEVPVAARADSLCSVAILREGLTIFEDLVNEPCTLVNPEAARQLELFFYAGQSLRTSAGLAIGSLCIIDHKARHLAPAEAELLQQLALLAQDLLHLQAMKAADKTLLPSLRIRLERPVRQALARLDSLNQLSQMNPAATPAEVQSTLNARFDEARQLTMTMHEELRRALAAAALR